MLLYNRIERAGLPLGGGHKNQLESELGAARATIEELTLERDAERHHRINLDVIVTNLTDKAGQLERALETAHRSVDDWREAWEQKQIELENVEAERDAATARAERAADLCARFEALTTDLAKALPMSIKSELTVEHLRRLQDEGVSLMTARAALAEQGEG